VSKKQFSITGDILSRNFGSKKENPGVDGSASTPETIRAIRRIELIRLKPSWRVNFEGTARLVAAPSKALLV